MAKTYYWVCANSSRYRNGWRFTSLRTARRGAFRHLKADKSTRGYSEIVIDTPDMVRYVGIVQAEGDRITYHEDFYPPLKLTGKKWILNSDGTVGKRL